ncbi:putative serine protease PepD [Haloactinopolyspora alba]|uniref:Putative serine protease PepD n=1 Tax=Haloactinopolyspora alba TaxID=648780 RepID=A0A2P8E2G3_9ACTN|nr:trypsin-like peptidase domain-containing protein [Haloactinopolyspora alba]PSL03665.1 putative serine protease PepD [Haloactinopolyspora alba]
MSDDTNDTGRNDRPASPPTPGPTPPPPATNTGGTGWSTPAGSPAGRPGPWTSAGQETPPAGEADTTGAEPTREQPATGESSATTPTGSAADGSGTATGGAASGGAAPPSDTSVFGVATPPPGGSGTTTAPEPRRKGRGRLVLAGLAIGAILGGGAGAGVTQLVDDEAETAPSNAERSDLDVGTDGEAGGSNDDDSANGQPAATGSDVQQVADQVLPSVVSISVRSQMGQAGGTGVVISSDGEILTNNHVVAAAAQGGGALQVTFADNTTAEAEVVGTDPLTDLAVIKAQGVSGLTPAELGSSADLGVGQQVVAIGSPLGLDGTVTSGIVSAMNRPVVAGQQQQQSGTNSVINAIQTDAPINPGNSGGPLVNMNGEVIGINSAIATAGQSSGSIGLGFSIPIDQAKPIVEQLLDGQEATHARIGVGVNNPQDTRGAYIASVNPGSGGDEAGLQEGDIVTAVDDRPVNSATSLIAAIRTYRPGDEVTLTYLRDGEEQTAQVTLGSDTETT